MTIGNSLIKWVFYRKFMPNSNFRASKDEKKPINENPSEKVFTKEELKKYDGSENSPGIYIAILGQVFDVTKAPKYYGPNGGYGFFAGKNF